jgi:hypothetical protein
MNRKRLLEPTKSISLQMPVRYCKLEEKLQELHGDVSRAQIRRAALERGLEELLKLEAANKPNPPLS